MIAFDTPSAQVSPIIHPFADAFLLGFVSAMSFISALFFLRFWKHTRDTLFLSFTFFFVIQGIGNAALLGVEHPNEGGLWYTASRFLAIIAVLGSIVWKNVGDK